LLLIIPTRPLSLNFYRFPSLFNYRLSLITSTFIILLSLLFLSTLFLLFLDRRSISLQV
jgi:hypothetical protein